MTWLQISPFGRLRTVFEKVSVYLKKVNVDRIVPAMVDSLKRLIGVSFNAQARHLAGSSLLEPSRDQLT
jgi:hypothetical protein